MNHCRFLFGIFFSVSVSTVCTAAHCILIIKIHRKYFNSKNEKEKCQKRRKNTNIFPLVFIHPIFLVTLQMQHLKWMANIFFHVFKSEIAWGAKENIKYIRCKEEKQETKNTEMFSTDNINVDIELKLIQQMTWHSSLNALFTRCDTKNEIIEKEKLS